MSITGRRTDVQIKAYTQLKCEFLREVGKFTARIKAAQIYWKYENGVWRVDFVVLEGPVIRKSDGAESTRQVSETTFAPGHQRASYEPVTPSEIVEFALANPPQWVPNFREIPLADTPTATNVEEQAAGSFVRTLSRWFRLRSAGVE